MTSSSVVTSRAGAALVTATAALSGRPITSVVIGNLMSPRIACQRNSGIGESSIARPGLREVPSRVPVAENRPQLGKER
ncbi:hypothetical protein TSAR_002104 [Trichomalopsis sarcophagae]|uniref:Uncharacterized protein n=1 Tax=Trichomalopsis sarcophagae TaxID=543379 RepID=A0A232EPI2_9HYME|nr:hypothetical protein TSAR_002104 [Trichomalopsis sarcophagae]